MVEGIEQDPSVWEKLFPFEFRRYLAREFVQKVSDLESVATVFAMEVNDDEGNRHQRLFVFVKGCECGVCLGSMPDFDAMEKVNRVFSEVCPDEPSRVCLSFVPVLTEDIFLEDRQNFEIKYRRVTVLFDREGIFSSQYLNAEIN